MQEEGGHIQVGQVLRTELCSVAGRVKWVGKQQKAISKLRFFCNKHAGLASAVGVASEEGSTGNELSHHGDGVGESLTVASGVAGTGRAEGTDLPEWQVAAQHSQAGCGESARQSNQQGRLAVRTGAVGEYEAMPVGLDWSVEEASDGRICCAIVERFDLRDGRHVIFGGGSTSGAKARGFLELNAGLKPCASQKQSAVILGENASMQPC